EEVDEVAVLLEPRQRGADAQLDALHGVGLVGDGGLLAPPQLLLRLAEDLTEQLLLGGEVPVEDTLSHAEALDDLRHRGGVVAVLGEALGGVLHELLATLETSLGQAAGHGPKLDRAVK